MPDLTRIIEQTATESIYNDDWLIKDSVTQGTTKIQPSVLKAWINDGMATEEELETAVDDTITKLSAVGSASGAIATFDDGSNLPMPSLNVSIEPVQSGSGDPSPENIRPISGCDEMNVTVCGKNLLPLKFYKGLQYNDSIGNTFDTEEVTDGTISGNTVSFNIGGWSRKCMLSQKLPSNVEFRLTMTVTSSTSNLNYTEFYLDKDLKVTRKYNIQNGGTSRIVNAVFNLNDNECYIAIELGCSSSATIVFDSPMLNINPTPITYEPYNGQTYTIDLDGTRYGGTLDVVSGVLTVDRAYVDLGTLNWALESGIFRLTSNVGAKITSNTSEVANMICSIYKTVSQSTMSGGADKCVAGLNWGYGVRVTDTSYSDASSFKTAMNGVQLVYELANPQTYQLTPTQVNSLLGVNNIWADTGDVLDAEYIRDMTTIINYLIARIEMLENQ